MVFSSSNSWNHRTKLVLEMLHFSCFGSLVTIFITCLSQSRKASGFCYYPNGTADSTRGQVPCQEDGTHSMCCWMDVSNSHPDPDRCRNDGLCIPADSSGLWRNTCTDPTWSDPACVHLCIDGTSKVFLKIHSCIVMHLLTYLSRSI